MTVKKKPIPISNSPEYRAWLTMKTRCFNPRRKDFPNYGGAGITVCPEWQNDFIRFLADIGPRPSARHGLSRLNKRGNYEPGNVIWETARQSGERRRSQARREAGCRRMPYFTVRKLLTLGWVPPQEKES
jgi:hypothetical protein